MTTIQELRQQLDSIMAESQFQQVSADVAQYLREKLLEAGEDTRNATDVLHGKQIGHPLHPILTDITIGAWTLGVFFDVLALIIPSPWVRKSANAMIGLGTLSAIPTALVGLTDYSTIKQDAAGYAATHGLLNGIAFFCFASSTVARFQRNSGSAFFFSILGSIVATLSAWVGGDMVYRQRVGGNHSEKAELENWTAVMAEDDLKNAAPTAVKVGNQPILLFPDGEKIYAIGAVCSHAGGPLEEGMVNGTCIECPWHQSVYDMKDGQVVHGPSTFNQPRYSVRTRSGQIEIHDWTSNLTSRTEDSLYSAPASQPELLDDKGDVPDIDDVPSQAEGVRK